MMCHALCLEEKANKKKTFAYGNVAHVKEERCVNVKISKAYSPLAGRKTRPAEGLLPSLCWC